METLSRDFSRMEGWTLPLSAIEAESDRAQIAAKEQIRPCGCGVKLDLQDVVYPSLRDLGQSDVAGLGTRVDASVSPGAFVSLHRVIAQFSEIESPSLAKKISDIAPDNLIELYSTGRSYGDDRAGTRKEFAEIAGKKQKLLSSGKIRFGKGHSILAGGNFVMFDLLKHDPAQKGYSVCNNDTIATAEALLCHWSWISVFTALNNALNDLFLLGVTEGLELFPVYDGDEREVKEIQTAIRRYQEFYSARAASIKVHDLGPLSAGTKLIGASVVGRALHELPGMPGLRPGQELLATRWLGDLSLLGHHRTFHFPLRDHGDMEAIRLGILQRFATPNFLVAKVIRGFLPELGEAFDPSRHISFSTDMSGPGLTVLEEGANASGVDVFVDEMRFIDERGLKFHRKNQTSSTNGPILLGASPEVIRRLETALQEIGVKETWRVGKVLGKSAEPTVVFHPALRARLGSADPQLDFFCPEVRYGSSSERVPLFQRYRFAEA